MHDDSTYDITARAYWKIGFAETGQFPSTSQSEEKHSLDKLSWTLNIRFQGKALTPSKESRKTYVSIFNPKKHSLKINFL